MATLDSQQWAEVGRLFAEALELPPEQRAEFLRTACGEEDLRREVVSLLEHAGEGLPNVVAAIIGTAGALAQAWGDDEELRLAAGESGLAEGQRLGDYRIVREIGRGGMGTVYLAERDDQQFRKQVAVKVVTQGMDTQELLVRFRRERQILAHLDHPYIARLLDGGSTPDGHPFLVMEYVPGVAITSYCDEHRLGTRPRIELFLKICAAVQSAHQNLVVHRDLKPGNILVDPQGGPKLLDFGIAKLLGGEEGDDLTVAKGGVRLTPYYASPEQVSGGAITTAADVYALGVILYELLAGVRPHHRDTAGEILRAVCEEEPEAPSAAWRRVTRGKAGHGPVLKPGDLDNVILMAMRKEPARRYGSVAEFTADLQRYLDGLPVRARKDTLTYRVRKFMQRHRAGMAAAALLVATLVAGVAVSTLEARRAQKRFGEVRRLAHAVLFDVYDSVRDLPGSLKARELVVKTALQYLDGLAMEAAGDQDLQLELAEAYQRVGDVQGSAYTRSLGQTAQAEVSYTKAKRIADQLARNQPEFTRANLIRMAARESLGDIAALRGSIEASLALYREGAEIGEAMTRRDRDNLQTLRLLAELYGASAKADQDNPRAVASAKKSVAIWERLAAAEPNNEDVQAELAESHSVLLSILASANQYDEALVEARNGVRIHEALCAAHPLNFRYRHDLMNTYENLGDAASGDTSAANALPHDSAEALDSYRKAVALADALVAADPDDQVGLEERGMALMKLGMTIPAEKDLKSALAMLRRALADFQTLSVAQPENTRVLRRLAGTHMYIGRRLSITGHAAEAAPSLRESIGITDAVIGKNPKDLLALNYSWRASQELAKVLAAPQQRSEALQFARKAIAAGEAARGADGANPVTQSFLPQAWSNAGDVYATLASAPGVPVEQRRADWLAARDSYQKSVAAWEQIQTQHAGTNNWDAQLTHARAEVKRCASAAAAIRSVLNN